ncbi:hypothetical protein VNO78_15569 [Psophocarpus tetragonolobus]|uniref:Uncharacterized protein n=1 Tax=Psophocarpus tetragonolobus TaxID=3891 RepID=A0AAN9SKE4_PSOTE
MREEMGSEETKVASKPSRRSVSEFHSDAGREIANAWELHRSPSPPPCVKVTEKETIVKGNNNSINEIDVSISYARYCYYMLEAMPQPGPTWSTTGPSVLAEPTPTPPPSSLTEATQDSSCSWWLEYFEDFDANLATEKLDPPFVENLVMENSKGLCYESTLVDAIDLSYCCPDDWLVIPTMEQDFGDIVMP